MYDVIQKRFSVSLILSCDSHMIVDQGMSLWYSLVGAIIFSTLEGSL